MTFADTNPGYWIPYEAARAVAATFCWHIRYALTPVFGKDFSNICLTPASEYFGSMQIDPEITKRCALQVQQYREMETHARSSPSSGISSPRMPQTPKTRPHLRKLKPKPYKLTPDSGSDYSTDTSQAEQYELSSPSPQIAFTNPWSAVNSPRSPRSPSPKVSFADPWSPASATRSASPGGISRKCRKAGNIPRSHTPLDLLPPPRQPLFPPVNSMLTEKLADAEMTEAPMIQQASPKGAARAMNIDEDYDAGSDDSDIEMRENQFAARKKSSRGITDAGAAYLLLSLKKHKDSIVTGLKSLKRRASA